MGRNDDYVDLKKSLDDFFMCSDEWAFFYSTYIHTEDNRSANNGRNKKKKFIKMNHFSFDATFVCF